MVTSQLYEVLPQPRTVSRDSGYTTPSPMVGNVSAKDNLKVCHNFFFLCIRDAVTKTQVLWGGETIFIYHATK